MIHLNINVVGHVQGVFFRASAKAKGDELGLTGFVRNEPDGGVYIEAEGAREQLEKLVSWCKQGPPRASVERVTTKDSEVKGFVGFEVRRF